MEFIKTHKSEFIISGVFLILGAIISGLFFWLGQEKVNLYYQINSIPIISKDQKTFMPLNDKLKINYSGNEVNNLTVTEIKFFNGGNKGIKGEDVSSTVPITFKLDKRYKIIDYIIDNEQTSQESEFVLKNIEKDNAIKINFKYMNPENRLIFRVLHTGNPYSKMSLNGKGFGFDNIKDFLKEKSFKKNIFEGIFMWGILVVMLIKTLNSSINLKRTREEFEKRYEEILESEIKRMQKTGFEENEIKNYIDHMLKQSKHIKEYNISKIKHTLYELIGDK